MAVSLKTAGTWAAVTSDSTVTLVGTPAAGDRHFILASWKTFSITSNVPNWTQVTEFADGSVAAGNGTGSMKVACWYRNWQSGDANPTLDFSAAPTIGAVCCMLWQKGAGEVWDDPTFVTAAWPSQSTGTLNASSTLAVPSGSVVMGLMGIPDDSALFTRVATSIGGSGITFNGDFVESPATHLTTTTGQDMAADLGHRFVTTGATATLTQTATLSAAETGAALWVVQGVSTANPVTVTPTAGSLTLTGSAPVLGAGVRPAAATVTASASTPTVLTPALVTPAAGPLMLVGPGLPYVLIFLLGAWAPVVGIGVIPGASSLTVTGATPTVTVGGNVTVTPDAGTLALTGSAPTVLTPLLLTPSAASITLAGSAPQLGSSILPAGGSLTLTGSASRLDTGIRPGAGTPTLTGSVPTVTVGGAQTVTPTAASLALTGSVPTVTVGGPQTVTPTAGMLTLIGFAPGGETTGILLSGTRNTAMALTGMRNTQAALAGALTTLVLTGVRETEDELAGVRNANMALAGTQTTESDL